MKDFVLSPCVSVCEMDEARGLCRGCLRTIEEISGWLQYSPAEKRAVLERIKQRKAEITEAKNSGRRLR